MLPLEPTRFAESRAVYTICYQSPLFLFSIWGYFNESPVLFHLF